MSLSQETIRTIIGVITLVGVGVGSYVSNQTQMAKMSAIGENLTNKVVELDKYDILLQNSIDSSKERIIRLEERMKINTRDYDRLINTMDNLGKKLELLGNKITEIKVRK